MLKYGNNILHAMPCKTTNLSEVKQDLERLLLLLVRQ